MLFTWAELMIFLPLLSPEFATEFLKGRSISLLQMFIVLQSCRRLLPLHLDISAGSRTRVLARCPSILRSFARIRQPAETKQSVYSIALQPSFAAVPTDKEKSQVPQYKGTLAGLSLYQYLTCGDELLPAFHFKKIHTCRKVFSPKLYNNRTVPG